MRKRVTNIRKMGIIILVSLLVFFIIMPVRLIYPTAGFNPIWLSTLLGFVGYYSATYFLCKKYQTKINPKKVLLLVLIGLLILQLRLRIISFKTTLVTFPEFLFNLFGIFAGYFSFVKRKIRGPLFITGVLLCAFMWFWGLTNGKTNYSPQTT